MLKHAKKQIDSARRSGHRPDVGSFSVGRCQVDDLTYGGCARWVAVNKRSVSRHWSVNTVKRFAYSQAPIWVALFLISWAHAPSSALADQPLDRYDAERDIDWPMYRDPLLKDGGRESVFDPRLKEIWLAALDRPDAETRRRAALAIARANGMGMKELTSTASTLLRELDKEGQPAALRLAAAHALIALDHRAAADRLLAWSTKVASQEWTLADRRDVTLLVDPALAAWEHDAALPVWRQRLAGEDVERAVRRSAIASLAARRDAAAGDALVTLAADKSVDVGTRLAASRAVGLSVDSGLTAKAQALAGGGLIDRLVAVNVLKRHTDAAAIELLKSFAQDAAPTVAAGALARLLAIDPVHVAPMAVSLTKNADAKVRRLAAEALIAQRTADAVNTLGVLLNDASTDVRRYVRDQFIELAKDPSLDDAVRSAAGGALGRDGWRGQITAAVVLGRLDHEPAAPRMVELMQTTTRNDVRQGMIIGLRRLAVEGTLPAVLEQAQRLSRLWLAEVAKVKSDPDYKVPKGQAKAYDHQLAHIHQMFALMKYAPAEAHLRKFIPKDSGYNPEARGAAVFALGYLYEGRPNDQLVELCRQRLADTNPLNPETNQVRRFSAVLVGRMKSDKATSSLRHYLQQEPYSADVGGACRWALMQVTGEDLPPLPKLTTSRRGLFLQTLDAR